MKQAKEKLNTLSADEEVRILAELREKAIRDEKSLKEAYYNEGLADKNRENAKKMKERGYKIEEIIEITNLTKEEIEKL